MDQHPSTERNIIFALSPPDAEGKRSIIVGVSRAAWAFMKHGRTHNFDLSSIGIPLQFVLFGGGSHKEIMDAVSKAPQQLGQEILDRRAEKNAFKVDDVMPESMEAARRYVEGLGDGIMIREQDIKRLYEVMRQAEDDAIYAIAEGLKEKSDG